MRRAVKPLFDVPADLTTLPAPPVPAGLDLRHFDCMHLNTRDLLESPIWEECSDAAIATALRFWAKAWQQVPCGSLPNDATKLREWAGCLGNNKRWMSVRFTALRGFELCSDGRLYHHKVAHAALQAAKKSKAGKRGAAARWGLNETPKSRRNNKTADATAYGTQHGKPDGRYDDIIYGNGDGRPHGKTDAEKGRDIPSPLPPSLPAAGSVGAADAPTSRPSARPQAPKPARSNAHGVELADGRVCVHYPEHRPGQKPRQLLWISPSGGVDEVSLERDTEPVSFTRDEALTLRNRAVAERNTPVTELVPAAESADERGELPAFLDRRPAAVGVGT